MINCKFSRYLLLCCLFLSVLFTSLSTSCHLVNASSSIPNTDITYDLWYWNNSNQWITFQNSQDGLVPNQVYRVRVRFNLPTSQNLQQGYNINFTFLHQASEISDITLNVLDNNGTIHSGDDIYYSGITVTNNTALTRTNIQINNFVCYNAPWAILTFAYRSTAQVVPNQPSNGYIQVSVQNFTITEESPTAAINNLAILINNSFADMISSLTQGSSDIVDAVEDSSGGIIDGIIDLGSDLLGGLGSLGSDLLGGLGSLGSDILGGLSSLADSIGTFISDLGDFLIDGIFDLFVPSSEDFQEWIETFPSEIMEANPLFGSIITIFTDAFETIENGTRVESFTVPEVAFSINGTPLRVGGWEVPLFPTDIPSRITWLNLVRTSTSALLGFWLINLCFVRIKETLGAKDTTEV